MKKLILSLFLSLFAVSAIGSTVFASPEVNEASKEILPKIESIANNSDYIDLIDINELPEGAPVINFDTVEDFEQAIKELENEDTELNLYEDTESSSLSTPLITTMATSSTTDRLEVWVKPSLNPIKSATQPVTVTVDLSYRYNGSGSSKTFSSITGVSSFSLAFPTIWVQTGYSSFFYNFNKGVTIELLGYNRLGIVIGEQPIGAQVKDEITFSYALGGSKTLFEK